MQRKQGENAKRPESTSQSVASSDKARKSSLGLVKLGKTKTYLQGTDGRYSDYDSGRAYYK